MTYLLGPQISSHLSRHDMTCLSGSFRFPDFESFVAICLRHDPAQNRVICRKRCRDKLAQGNAARAARGRTRGTGTEWRAARCLRSSHSSSVARWCIRPVVHSRSYGRALVRLRRRAWFRHGGDNRNCPERRPPRSTATSRWSRCVMTGRLTAARLLLFGAFRRSARPPPGTSV